MTATIRRLVGWLLGTLTILVPEAMLLLIAGQAFKLIAATLGVTAVSLLIVFLLIMWLLVKAATILQQS